jgi:hypothetical protein
MASYVGDTLLLKKAAAVFLLLLGALAVVVGLYEELFPVLALGCVSMLGGVVLLVVKIVRRNQSSPL